ncbi:uncharacterized protein FIBRA_00774 [Fibroporia radiculosa]|uniref:Uncharacterized protein n=1 Tax=Fibroporia radiculosa TaxID=599839 RepID=J4H0P0_9APHY|nr:uncharacterized protein FIBRA_00774 [Fibroporia radiculosa]CCL98769.1 predicted protein [Fibroporia radiculosa]
MIEKTSRLEQAAIVGLSYDILVQIIDSLVVNDAVHFLSTCSSLHTIMKDEWFWKHLCSHHGVPDATAFGVHSFRALFTTLLYPYSPLLGLWAGDHPFTGNILEFRVVPRFGKQPGGIVGEMWRFRVLELESGDEPEAPETPEFVPLVWIGFSQQDLVRGRTDAATALSAQLFCCVDATRKHAMELKVLPETALGTILHTRHGQFMHPDFPDPELSAWLDTCRALPRVTDTSLKSAHYPPLSPLRSRPRVFELFPVPTDCWKPRAIALTCERGCIKASQPFLGFKNDAPFPPRYYPLRHCVPRGISPSSDSWSPASLCGLWLGSYSSHGTECVFVGWDETRRSLRAVKITGDENVPRGVVSWEARAPPADFASLDANEQQSCSRVLGGDVHRCLLFRGAGTMSSRGFLPSGRYFPSMVLAISSIDEMNVVWLDTGAEWGSSFVRCKGCRRDP